MGFSAGARPPEGFAAPLYPPRGQPAIWIRKFGTTTASLSAGAGSQVRRKSVLGWANRSDNPFLRPMSRALWPSAVNGAWSLFQHIPKLKLFDGVLFARFREGVALVAAGCGSGPRSKIPGDRRTARAGMPRGQSDRGRSHWTWQASGGSTAKGAEQGPLIKRATARSAEPQLGGSRDGRSPCSWSRSCGHLAGLGRNRAGSPGDLT